MVDLGIFPKELLLALLVGQVPPDLVTVLLGLQERDQVNASPDLLTRVFAVRGK